MSQIKFDSPFQFKLSISIIHNVFLLLAHLLALFVLFLPFDLPFILKVLLVIYVMISFLIYSKRTTRNYTGDLRYLDNNNWLWLKEGEEIKLQLKNGIILQPQLITLTFQDAKQKKFYWTLFPDSVDKESFRRLRVLLRHSTAETQSSPV